MIFRRFWVYFRVFAWIPWLFLEIFKNTYKNVLFKPIPVISRGQVLACHVMSAPERCERVTSCPPQNAVSVSRHVRPRTLWACHVMSAPERLWGAHCAPLREKTRTFRLRMRTFRGNSKGYGLCWLQVVFSDFLKCYVFSEYVFRDFGSLSAPNALRCIKLSSWNPQCAPFKILLWRLLRTIDSSRTPSTSWSTATPSSGDFH